MAAHLVGLAPVQQAGMVQDAIRRRESQATMRQNMETADRKKKMIEQERARERTIDGSTLASEKQWWNYGAASEKVCVLLSVKIQVAACSDARSDKLCLMNSCTL